MDDFDTKRGIALLMGYSTKRNVYVNATCPQWSIVYPSGVETTFTYGKEEHAWSDIFDIAGITNGRLFAGE